MLKWYIHSSKINPPFSQKSSFVWLQDNCLWVHGLLLASEAISMSMRLLEYPSTFLMGGEQWAPKRFKPPAVSHKVTPHGPLTQSNDQAETRSHIYLPMIPPAHNSLSLSLWQNIAGVEGCVWRLSARLYTLLDFVNLVSHFTVTCQRFQVQDKQEKVIKGVEAEWFHLAPPSNPH